MAWWWIWFWRCYFCRQWHAFGICWNVIDFFWIWPCYQPTTCIDLPFRLWDSRFPCCLISRWYPWTLHWILLILFSLEIILHYALSYFYGNICHRKTLHNFHWWRKSSPLSKILSLYLQSYNCLSFWRILLIFILRCLTVLNHCSPEHRHSHLLQWPEYDGSHMRNWRCWYHLVIEV